MPTKRKLSKLERELEAKIRYEAEVRATAREKFESRMRTKSRFWVNAFPRSHETLVQDYITILRNHYAQE
jgi:hypothetical protein